MVLGEIACLMHDKAIEWFEFQRSLLARLISTNSLKNKDYVYAF